MTGKEDKEEDDAFYKGLSYASRIGVELVAATLVGTGIGYFADRYFNTSPWLMIAGVLIGSAAGFLNIFRFVQSQQTNKK
ncbi:MAG: AtpZ/AtpI family protein [Nitrospiria bacterium]